MHPPRIGLLEQNETPYARLHVQIVTKLGAGYQKAGSDTKERMLRYLNDMAEEQTLFPGDTGRIEETINVVVEAKRLDNQASPPQGRISENRTGGAVSPISPRSRFSPSPTVNGSIVRSRY
jgi:hypothetical protein